MVITMKKEVFEMDFDPGVLNSEEKVIYGLRSLYEKFGYSQYRMSRFEEYDLYVRNKDFLISDNVITFTDTDGKLMALKPDVTLSIVRASRDEPDSPLKLYYDENVFRVSGRSRRFREITQTGLEYLGEIDDYVVSEVLQLACRSLRTISRNSILDISDLDIVRTAVEELGLKDDLTATILKYLGQKNVHEIENVCSSAGASESDIRRLTDLIRISGDPDKAISILKQGGYSGAAVKHLETLVSLLRQNGFYDMVRIDFSVVNDMNYYNGTVFKGYVAGIPSGILSGGRYDRLMKRMGKRAGAIGFAVYLDLLSQATSAKDDYDVDVLLLYDRSSSPEDISNAVRTLTESGLSVSAQKNADTRIRYRKRAVLKGSEAVFDDTVC